MNTKSNHEEVLQTLLALLRRDQQWHVSELAQMLHSNVRSVYKYLVELEERGIRINRNYGHPRLFSLSLDYDGLDCCPLADSDIEEAFRLLRRVRGDHGEATENSFEALRSLKTLLVPYFGLIPTNNVDCVSAINMAINRHVQIVIHDYQSGNSGQVEDRLVEPVHWSPNGRQLSAYDVNKQGMRTFVPSRMSKVTLTKTPWCHTKEHQVVEYDCFWMSGEPFEVTLRMSLRALNLLHEEYEQTMELAVTNVADEDPQHPYQMTLVCRSRHGVGRFVRGLPDDVQVVAGL